MDLSALKAKVKTLTKTYDDLGTRSEAIAANINRLLETTEAMEDELKTALSEINAIRRARIAQMEDFRETLRSVAPQYARDLFP